MHETKIRLKLDQFYDALFSYVFLPIVLQRYRKELKGFQTLLR